MGEVILKPVYVSDDHKSIDVDCEHLAAQIEEHILLHHEPVSLLIGWTVLTGQNFFSETQRVS